MRARVKNPCYTMRCQIQRRTFLRGVGAAMALPLLDAMMPSVTRSALAAGTESSSALPKRMAFCYVPNGATMEHWTPHGTGANFSLPRILQPLEKFRKDLCVLTGFAQENGNA